jgi:hypothetical protein
LGDGPEVVVGEVGVVGIVEGGEAVGVGGVGVIVGGGALEVFDAVARGVVGEGFVV